MLPQFSYIRPQSMQEVLRQLAAADAHVHAGGTDLIGCFRDGIYKGGRVVSLANVKELKGVSQRSDGGLSIGAMTTLSEIAAHPTIRDRYRALALGAASAASPQLRNQGTLGGNLCQRPRCWYFRGGFTCARKGGNGCYAVYGENEYHAIIGAAGCCVVNPSETAAPLIALGARVRILSKGSDRTIPLGDFFIGPDRDITRENVLKPAEILAQIYLPPASRGLRSTYRKVRTRGAWDFALAGAAVALHFSAGRIEAARVVLSGIAPIPWRAPEAEAELTGKKPDAATARAAAEAAVRDAQPLEKNAYKIAMVRGALEDALLSLA